MFYGELQKLISFNTRLNGSFSESDSDKIGKLSLAPKSPTNHTLNTNSDHVFGIHHSNPNLSPPEDLYMKLQLGL